MTPVRSFLRGWSPRLLFVAAATLVLQFALLAYRVRLSDPSLERPALHHADWYESSRDNERWTVSIREDTPFTTSPARAWAMPAVRLALVRYTTETGYIRGRPGRLGMSLDVPGWVWIPPVRNEFMYVPNYTIGYGWPMVSFVHAYRHDTYSSAYHGIPRFGLGAYELPRTFPNRVIWTGLAVNTLVLGVAWAVPLFGSVAFVKRLRRLLRVRKGLCPACAYPSVAGGACPECGYVG